MKKFTVLLAFVTTIAASAANLLDNPSFEEADNQKIHSSWKVALVKGWLIYYHSGAKNCHAEYIDSAFEGKHAIRLMAKSKDAFTQAAHLRLIAVKPGDKLAASVMIQGKGIGFFRIYYCGKDGKTLPNKYFIFSGSAYPQWRKISATTIVPEGTAFVKFTLETLKADSDVCFDNPTLEMVNAPEK